MTPEEEAMLAYMMGYGTYGLPLMPSAASQLNLVQDAGMMTFDPVFMYNSGLITPDMLLMQIRNATHEPVGDANEYDYESMLNRASAAGEQELLQGMSDIMNGVNTASGYVRRLKAKLLDADPETSSARMSLYDSMQSELEKFEKVWSNYQIVEEKRQTGEYFIDESTGMLMKPLLGEKARENLRAMGWKGPLSEPEFWRTIPDMATVDQAAKLQEQLRPQMEAYERDQEIVESGWKTRGWKDIEDAYQRALTQFSMPQTTRQLGYEELGTINGFNVILRQEEGKTKAYRYDSNGKLKAISQPLSDTEISQLRNESADRKYNPGKYRQEIKLPNSGKIVYEAGKSYLETTAPGGRPTTRTEVKSSTKQPTQEQKSQDYWARQAAYYTAKGMGEERQRKKEVAANAEAQVAAKMLEAQQRGTVPALQWLQRMPQLAALAAMPAPEKPKATRPAPRVLSDQEIDTMANMIAGGMQ